MSFVKCIHTHISAALSSSLVGGPKGIERALKKWRGHASYAENRVVSFVTGDIFKEVIEDPA